MECTWNVSLCVLGNELHHFNISVVRCYLQGSTAILCLDINGGTGAEEYPGRNVLTADTTEHALSRYSLTFKGAPACSSKVLPSELTCDELLA